MGIRLYPLTSNPEKLARLSGSRLQDAQEYLANRKQIEAELRVWDCQGKEERPYPHLEHFQSFYLFGWGKSAAHRHHKGLISGECGEIEAELVSQLEFVGWDGKPWIINGWERCSHILFCQGQYSELLRWSFNEGGIRGIDGLLELAEGVRWE